MNVNSRFCSTLVHPLALPSQAPMVLKLQNVHIYWKNAFSLLTVSLFKIGDHHLKDKEFKLAYGLAEKLIEKSERIGKPFMGTGSFDLFPQPSTEWIHIYDMFTIAQKTQAPYYNHLMNTFLHPKVLHELANTKSKPVLLCPISLFLYHQHVDIRFSIRAFCDNGIPVMLSDCHPSLAGTRFYFDLLVYFVYCAHLDLGMLHGAMVTSIKHNSPKGKNTTEVLQHYEKQWKSFTTDVFKKLVEMKKEQRALAYPPFVEH